MRTSRQAARHVKESSRRASIPGGGGRGGGRVPSQGLWGCTRRASRCFPNLHLLTLGSPIRRCSREGTEWARMDKASPEAGLQEAPEPAWGLTRTTRERRARSLHTPGLTGPGAGWLSPVGRARNSEPGLRRNWDGR